MKKISVYEFHIGKRNIPQLVSDLQRSSPLFETERFFDEIIKIDFKEYSSRVLTHWEQKDILLSIREGDAGWRKFKVVESFWLNIIGELREYDISLDIIKGVKKILITKNPNGAFDYSQLKNLILCCFCRVPINLVLLNNEKGMQAGVVTNDWLKELIHPPSDFTSIIEINLNKIVQKVFPSEKLNAVDWTQRQTITTEEAKILLELRTNDWQKCTINRLDGKPLIISKTINENQKEKIVNILSKYEYVSINIEKKDGNIIAIQSTNSKKIK